MNSLNFLIDHDLLEQISIEHFKQHNSAPIVYSDGAKAIAYVTPKPYQWLELLEVHQCANLNYHELSIEQYKAIPGLHLVQNHTHDHQIDSPAVRLVNLCIQEAKHTGSSDIHFEALEEGAQVRIREDGILKVYRHIPLDHKNEVVSRLKIMADMDIAEKRRPQDGRIEFNFQGTKIDIRVSVIPTDFGEKVVLRLLDQSAVDLDLTKLGFPEGIYKEFQDNIRRPNGLILITGPTGSGKTTTLYSALKEISSDEINISTVEDPVEYRLPGINQTQVKPDIGVDFAAALRSLLRQDPNVILIGEIRDKETADLAIRASMTGHLVFSTLHTNDAPSAISRLMDMGVEPFQIASSLSLVIAQRLVRRICNDCNRVGCEKCSQTGYKGRTALYESLEVNDNIRELISQGVSTVQIKNQAKNSGWTPLREDGLVKVEQGLTTIEEINRETTA